MSRNSNHIQICIKLVLSGLCPSVALLTGAALLAQRNAERKPEKQGEINKTVAATAPTKSKLSPDAKRMIDSTLLKKNSPAKNGSSVIRLSESWKQEYELVSGKTVEIQAHLEKPSELPINGRVAVEWEYVGTGSQSLASNSPSVGFRKILHALDGDIYLVYRAPISGRYRLSLKTITDETPVGDASARWREKGNAPVIASLPAKTPWRAGFSAPVYVSVKPVAIDPTENSGAGSAKPAPYKTQTILECEPNDTPNLAQTITLSAGKGDEVRTWEISGGADDAEFFDNGKVGESEEDWFRLEYRGEEPRLMTAQLGIPGQVVAARVRCYVPKSAASPATSSVSTLPKAGESLKPIPAPSLADLVEFTDGQNANERVHQQDESHRSMISRLLKPGATYFLRAEANAPGYQLTLRTLKPGPYADPKMAIRQGMYQHIGQVDAWLTNRPRGISIDRRIRDTGNLLGTQCMSCHTQSGVWGPSVPVSNGYRIENVQNFRHMTDVMYECLRPTNVLKDAANNTSLAPLDIGDGPAGTRAAGFNLVNLERILKPGKLHSKQQIRTANFVLQTSDPGGINAAGPGSNVGQVIVATFSSEILKTAWEKSGDPKYFRALEEKAKAVLDYPVVYTDDVALRLSYFSRIFPIDLYLGESYQAANAETKRKLPSKTDPIAIQAFVAKVKTQLAQDEARLRAIQNSDGSWGFSPGSSSDGGKTWKPGDPTPDPSPTSLAVSALVALNFKPNDPSLAKGVKALLAMQEPSGRWNKAAQTGFISTAYALHALARLYPETPASPLKLSDFAPNPKETLAHAISRVRTAALSGDSKLNEVSLKAMTHGSPFVRYWAAIGLGMNHTAEGVPALILSLSDRVKMVRDAATWGLKQSLLDDRGWNETFAAYEKGDDDTRAQVLQALGMRADAVMPQSAVNWNRLISLFDKAMNHDPHPAVRAWASKAAWQWWVWNPPVRKGLNESWLTMLSRPETNALVENSNRYSTQALFVVNGHKANGSGEHQYKELATLFDSIAKKLDAPGDESVRMRLASRLIAVGGTFFQTAGGDGGPGQMGYITPGSGEMIGKAALLFLNRHSQPSKSPGELALLKAGIEGGSNVPYQPLTAFLVDYSLKGPEELRQLASSAVSDPRSVSLAAVPELVGPQLAQILRGANEPPRRPQLSDPILDLWGKVNWNIPKTEEQQRNFFDLVIPKLDRYLSPEEIAKIADPAKRAEAERESSANWYLAERLGETLQNNPDLHQDIVLLRYFPKETANPLQAAYWVRNVEWMLTYAPATPALPVANPKSAKRATDSKTSLASLNSQEAKPQTTDPKNVAPNPLDTVKDRVLQLYLDQLKPSADPKTRGSAIRAANRTALRRNPEVLRALAKVLEFEKNIELRSIIENALKQSSEKFMPDLLGELKREKDPSVHFDATGNPKLTAAQEKDIVFFRDDVMPELIRQKRSDQQACMGCHGVPGRVPSLYLKAPDKYGYTPVADLLFNYRTLQKKVILTDIERSKLLRKPLNIQDGKEDGHQGGRRYGPSDPGYLLIKEWAEAQPEVQKLADKTASTDGNTLHPRQFVLRKNDTTMSEGEELGVSRRRR